MNLSRGAASIFVPDGGPEGEALARTSHLGIGAHPDDLEIMALHGIGTCHTSRERWFSGVIVTDGRTSPRRGRYADVSDDAMVKLRLDEQKRAAELGDYSALVALAFTSAEIKDRQNAALIADLAAVIAATKPDVVYTHNLFDAHATHVAVALHTIAAIRTLAEADRPRALYGGEVWRGLDWLPPAHRIELDVSEYQALGQKLVALFDSQIAGGKRYDLATAGRKVAHATFSEPRVTDAALAVELVMDLTPLVRDPSLAIDAFAAAVIADATRAMKEPLAWK